MRIYTYREEKDKADEAKCFQLVNLDEGYLRVFIGLLQLFLWSEHFQSKRLGGNQRSTFREIQSGFLLTFGGGSKSKNQNILAIQTKT